MIDVAELMKFIIMLRKGYSQELVEDKICVAMIVPNKWVMLAVELRRMIRVIRFVVDLVFPNLQITIPLRLADLTLIFDY